MENAIERKIMINASQEKIYNTLTNPEELVKWFPDTIEGALAIGEQPVFVFDGHGKARILVVEARPSEYFSYRWVPGANNHSVEDVTTVQTTLVEFTISKEENGACTVTLTETGFADLPTEMGEVALNQNSNGWNFMLGRLEKCFATN